MVTGEPNPNIEHANRGKRSIGLDIAGPEGRRVLYDLVATSDVFLTSFLPGARQRLGIDVEDIRTVHPTIIYARGSALGPRGQEADRGGYDMTAFWARAATAASLTPAGMEGMIGPPAPAYGDTISGTNLAGGIAAALLKRERTGEPSIVDVSLLGSGLWSMGQGIALSLRLDNPWVAPAPGVHGSPVNPLSGVYATSDGRYLALVMILREVLATRTLAQWSRRFATLAGPWAPVQDSRQVGEDAQVRANEYLVRAGELELVASPVQFDLTAPQLQAAPEFAAQTEQILTELGLDWDRIIALKAAGAVT